MIIQFNKTEIYTIINALDFYSRIWIGQYNEILSNIRWYKNCSQLDNFEYEFKNLLMNIRHHLLPGLDNEGFYASYGIFSPEINYKSAVAYNMQQVFRYTVAYFEHPEGGITIDFNTPLKAKLDPYPFPKAECCKIDNKTIINIDINKKQLDIIYEALNIQIAELETDMTKLFRYYTEDEKILCLTEKLNNIFKNIDATNEKIIIKHKTDIENILNR